MSKSKALAQFPNSQIHQGKGESGLIPVGQSEEKHGGVHNFLRVWVVVNGPVHNSKFKGLNCQYLFLMPNDMNVHCIENNKANHLKSN